MAGFNNGRLLGVAWCCTVDEHGVEHDVAFGWTSRQAHRRCVRKQRQRSISPLPASA
jgi:hypothetical protein